MGLAKLDRHDYFGAIADFTDALKKNPGLAEAYCSRGIAKSSLRQELDEVEPFPAVSFVDYNPDRSEPNNANGGAIHKPINRSLTIDSLTEAIRINPGDPEAYFQRGSAMLVLANYRGAIDDFTRVIELSPENGPAYMGRSFAKRSQNDTIGANADFTKALEVDPGYEIVTYNFEGTKGEPEDFSDTMEDFNKAIEINPKYADAYYNRGLFKIKLGMGDSGCLDLRKAEELGCSEADNSLKEHCN